jgi:apolipoprotein N-acyltransferase
VYLVAGVQLNRAERKDNASWLFIPTGELVAEYHKQHLVPHLESDLAPGKEEIVRTISGAPFGLAICRDLIFTDFGRRYGRLGVSAMLVPAWDFYRDAWMASGVAALRGVESGYSVVRAGRESYLNVSDRYGHTIARQRSDYLPGSSVLADLPLGPATPTLYARYGNAFGWLAVAASAIMIVLAGRAGNQPKLATANA